MTALALQEHNDGPALEQKLAKQLAGFVAMSGMFKNCLTCGYFVEAMERCDKFAQRPPAKIIAYGCPEHTNTIPF